MGSVFMARQTEPVKRAVAVKVIKAGMDSKAVLARFEAERQALAMMDHPNIAKVLDAGTTESGRPFFVMELVKGVTITKFCDDRKLTPRQRLELFVPVCQAIQHAHQKGVIHRDIKPSNVLVALYDDRPVPKVIDFGVAKATGASLTERTIDTGFGGVVGTPQYMSPEQATFNNLDIDTRSDVYALGVLLYELLTGSPPFSKQDLEKRGLLEMLRVVREEEPPRPSTKLSTADALPALSANRGTEPRKLTGLLRNELDWIVMKALEKDRTRRYETANGFAADVLRYLAGEAVQAHPTSTIYRVNKFVRRRKGQVIAASLVLFALLAGIAGTTWGLFEARRQERLARAESHAKERAFQAEAERAEGEAKERRRAEAGESLAGDRLTQVAAEKKKAEDEKRIAVAMRDFLQNKLLGQADVTFQSFSLLAAGGSVGAARANLTIRELLDRAAGELTEKNIETSFPGQPLLQAEILMTMGVTYSGVGEAERGSGLLRRSLALRRRHLGPDHADTMQTMNELAMAYCDAGKVDLAIPLFEETLALRRTKLGPDHPDTLFSMHALSHGYRLDGRIDRIRVSLCEEIYETSKRAFGPGHPRSLACMLGLAQAYQAAGRRDSALPLFRDTLELMKAELGPEHPWTLVTMQNLGAAYVDAGKSHLGVPLLVETLDLSRTKLGPDHPHAVATMSSLALAYRTEGEMDLAMPILAEALRLSTAKLGPDHPNTLIRMSNLASGHLDAGNLSLAVSLFEETLRLMRAKLGPDHPSTLSCANGLAKAYHVSGKSELSLSLGEENLGRTRTKLGPDHPDTLTSMNNLAAGYIDARRFDLAMPLAEDAFRRTNAKLGLGHPLTLAVLRNLFNGYALSGETTKALPLVPELLAAARSGFPKGSPHLAEVLIVIGDVQLKSTAFAEAELLIGEGLAIRERKQPDVWTTFNAQSMLGGALLGQKKYADAEPLLRKGYEGMKQREKAIPPVGGIRIPEALDRLIELYTATNKPDEAKKWQAEREKYPSPPEVAPPPRAKK